jgi:glycosyltransferase involved in cell wall biosynthesis
VPKKGVKELLQAFQQLMKYNDVKLLVVGGDNFGDSVQSNVFLDELHEMADKMEGKVKFTGFVPYDQLPAYLKIADVAIVPSKINEALGMACIEACAMGLPVIATDDGGIAETLVGQKHILLKKDDNLPFHIAQAILKIKDNKPDFHGNKLNPIFSKEIYAETFFKAIAL